jgi:hypothetical protein
MALTDGVPVRWLTIFLDFPAASFDAGTAFWQAVTGYGRSAARGTDGQFATLLPPSGDAYLRVQRVAAGGGCHLDLHVDTGTESLDAATDRAVTAGAPVRHREDGLVVAESPGGFPFCLVSWEGERAVPPPLTPPPPVGGGGVSGGAAGAGVSRADTLCLDVPPGHFERELAFWAALTGQEARPAPVAGFYYLTRPESWPARLLLQRRDRAAPGDRTSGHVDFGCTDPAARGRHVALGARVTAEHQYWTVLADPAGHEYCLVGRDPVS